ncbi:ferredoxin [Sulfitobacter sp. S190]|nr:ferredoxin [Sulfitobacter sp. S190]
MPMGALHDAGRTLVLVATAPDFWHHFENSPEMSDGAPDPVDRWSQRILPRIATGCGAREVVYPFGGPPFEPFIAWAKASGEAFDSPTGMLVHLRAGLMISYRGALVFEGQHPLPDANHRSPCDSCATRPCETACPVGALSPDHFYDVPRCKAYLNSAEGADCMTNGCAVRRACPVSVSFNRPPRQSAHHMRYFKGNAP